MTASDSVSNSALPWYRRDIVGTRAGGIQTNGTADDEGDGLGLGFAHCLGRHGAALGLVQKFVTYLMY